jgi:hypothetical protein
VILRWRCYLFYLVVICGLEKVDLVGFRSR